MTLAADRRQLLAGLASLSLMGCSRSKQDAELSGPVTLDVDFAPLEDRFGGRLGLAARDAKGRIIDWRGDERFVYCSTFKMYLAAAVLLKLQAGRERLDRALPITRADMINNAPVTEPAIGRTLTIEQLCKGTVEVSDNPAANILIRELGGLDAMRAFYRGIGDRSTRVDRWEPEMNRLDGDKDTITPAQSAVNLERLFVSADTPLNAASKALLLGWMFDSPTGRGRIKAGAPADWRVAHKTGTGGYGPTNDIGLLYPPSGAPIILAVYYHGPSDRPENEAVIAEATRIALKAMGHG